MTIPVGGYMMKLSFFIFPLMSIAIVAALSYPFCFRKTNWSSRCEGSEEEAYTRASTRASRHEASERTNLRSLEYSPKYNTGGCCNTGGERSGREQIRLGELSFRRVERTTCDARGTQTFVQHTFHKSFGLIITPQLKLKKKVIRKSTGGL